MDPSWGSTFIFSRKELTRLLGFVIIRLGGRAMEKKFQDLVKSGPHHRGAINKGILKDFKGETGGSAAGWSLFELTASCVNFQQSTAKSSKKPSCVNILRTPKSPKVRTHRTSRISNFGRSRMQTGVPNSYSREKSRPVFWGLS